MRPPSYYTVVRTVLAKDLRLEFQRPDSFIAASVFALVVLILFHFSLDRLGATERPQWLPGLLWTVLSFAGIVGMARTFRDEQARDTLGALLQSPADRTAIFLGKFLANLLRMGLLAAVLTPLTLILFPVTLPVALPWGLLPLVETLALFGFSLTLLGTFFSSITARLRRGESLLTLLLIPAAVPVLLGAIRCTEAAIQDGSLEAVRWPWIGVGAGFAGLYFFLAMVAFEFIIED